MSTMFSTTHPSEEAGSNLPCSAVVLELSCLSARIGCAGESEPQAELPMAVGEPVSSSIRTLRESTAPRSFPLNPLEVQQDLDVIKPLSYDSKTAQYRVSDMEGIERILQFILNSDASKYFCPVHPLSVPLVLLEPALTNTAFRDAVAEILFDSLECPSLFFAKQPALAAFGCGRMSAAVYDSGFSRTTTSIVVEGYVLPKSVVELGIGGDFANKRLASIMGNANPILSENVGSHTISRDKDTAKKSYEATTFCPFFAYSSQPPYHPQRKPFISDSYWQWGLESTMESIRRECCAFKVADTTTSPRAYTLPDGSCISTESFGTVFPELFAVGVEEAGIPSDWIDPEVLDRMASYQLPNCGWMAMLNKSVELSDLKSSAKGKHAGPDAVVVAGGLACCKAFARRFKETMDETDASTKNGRSGATHSVRQKVLFPPDKSLRRHTAFIGGSILGCLGTLPSLLVSKSEYYEHGSVIFQRKCP